MQVLLLSLISISCIYSYGGITPLEESKIPTVLLFLFFNKGLIFHYSGGITPYDANICATVFKQPSVKYGS